ncbi:MAG: DUF1592 domain-containing protein [Verrucomicrobiales bacterium]
MRASTILLLVFPLLQWPSLQAQEEAGLEQIRTAAAARSKYLSTRLDPASSDAPKADLEGFRKEIAPILEASCLDCHGPEKQKAKFRVDTLDPDLVHGGDAEWWLGVMDALSNGEMPPDDAPDLAEADRSRIIDWLSGEIGLASDVRRAGPGHSSFRRMTRYEFNYALQDLLGLQLDFAKDLPPDPVSEDGFRNSSELLQMSPRQYAHYLELNRDALGRATVRGERPEVLYWGVSAERAWATKSRRSGGADTRDRQRGGRGGGGARYKNTKTGQTLPASWSFRRAVNAWLPTATRPEVPEPSDYIAVLPAGERLVVELGNRLPDEGTLRVRVRAWRTSSDPSLVPALALEFGWQGSNNSKASVKLSEREHEINAPPGKPQFYQWDIPLSDIYPRNPVRKTVKLGTSKMTNPSEYIRLHNTALSRSADVEIDYVEVSAPVYDQWPPTSHTGIFVGGENSTDEDAYAREIVSRFMGRAWRRSVTEAEVDQKMEFFTRIRPGCEDFQQAVIETLATILSSPRFLYLVQSGGSPGRSDRALDEFELATRLSMFLWCSIPDDELLDLAGEGRLSDEGELVSQTQRMLADPRHERFSKHFVRQWLDMELLDYLNVDRSAYPEFDSSLKGAMQQEPVAFFEETLQDNRSVMDFIHADFALVNQALAQHYGISGVSGQGFQKVSVKADGHRGGLLTMAGLLAMNSDGKDSNPLKRGIWLLESILNDPPPPPPPAVPEIDLADPKILKMTLKERMEDHRNKPACASCHMKIDPWGIALENFDAVGSWRMQHRGRDVDASSLLFNQQKIDGIVGLKRYLLANRQDQFARAIAHKMTTFALGRPLNFADRASIDRLTAELRKEGDGLATLVTLIVTSELFQSR